MEEIAALAFDGFALGGLAVGESRAEMLDTVAWSAPLLPADRPRYFMGLGDPEGILEVVARGIDMFDCVLPTRTARTGSAPDVVLGGLSLWIEDKAVHWLDVAIRVGHTPRL